VSSSDARLYSGQRPRSVENIELRSAAHSPLTLNNIRSPSASRLTGDSRHSLPRSAGHHHPASPAGAWASPGPREQYGSSYEARPQNDPQSLALLDRYRSRSLSADRRTYFPPLQADVTSQRRREETQQQLENTRREVSRIVTQRLACTSLYHNAYTIHNPFI